MRTGRDRWRLLLLLLRPSAASDVRGSGGTNRSVTRWKLLRWTMPPDGQKVSVGMEALVVEAEEKIAAPPAPQLALTSVTLADMDCEDAAMLYATGTSPTLASWNV